jgi:hypothetical protein
MAKRMVLKGAVLVLTVLGMIGVAGVLGGAEAFAAPTAAGVTSTATPPTTVRCTTPGHSNPCWATTTDSRDGGLYGCPNAVPLFLRQGGEKCIGGNVLVLITCYYRTAAGYQDHVVQEYAGRQHDTGHIPDRFINLDNHNPPDVHIPHC